MLAVVTGWKLRRGGWRALAVIAVLLSLFGPLGHAQYAVEARASDSVAMYTNPIIAQTTPDPSVIKALDGFYYLAASSDYWQGGTLHLLPIWRSTDLVHWSFVRDAFPTRPDWVDPSAGLWAPDLQYYNHTYYLYYTASNTRPLPAYGTSSGSAIGVATADTPAGPWTDMGPSAGGSFAHGPLIPPRACAFNTDPTCYYWTFDPAEFTDQDGQKYLYYGSYFGGTLVQPLAPDGLHTAGPAIQIGHWDRYEGTYVVRHDVDGRPYYYNFSSSANCCLGPNTGYSVVVNRATSPTGTFVDQNGFPMLRPGSVPAPTSRPVDDPAGDNIGAQGGGYPTLKPNGNRWQGTGHNAIITDLSGQDWIVYHGVDKHNGWVGAPGLTIPITFRQALLDRLDWTADGWPVVNGGTGPSEQNVAPVTAPLAGDNFNAPSGCAAPGPGSSLAGWRTLSGAWSVETGTCVTGGFLTGQATDGPALLVTAATPVPNARAECDLRLASATDAAPYGCVVAFGAQGAAPGRYLVVALDPARNILLAYPINNDRSLGQPASAPLPAGFDHTDWHHLAVDVTSSGPGLTHVHVVLSDRNRDPLAVLQEAVPAAFGSVAGVGVAVLGGSASFDNVTLAPLAAGLQQAQGIPPVGALLTAYSDEFNGPLGPQWQIVRPDASSYSLANGQLSILLHGDLYRDANNATNLFLEAPPAGDYAVETRLTFDPNQNYQQAGLLIYSDDDHYIKVGPFHGDSLTKVLSGHESLEPVAPSQTACVVQPSATSNVAVHTYTAAACPNEGEAWDYLSNPSPTANGGSAANPTVTDWLRIYRHGDTYTPYVSLDDEHWVRGTSWDLVAADDGFPVRIGLFAFSAGSGTGIPARFDYLHVYTVGNG